MIAQSTHTTAFYKRFILVLWLPSLLTPLLFTNVSYKYCDCPVYSHHFFLQTFYTSTVTAQFTHTTAFYKRFIPVLWLPSLLTPLLFINFSYNYCDCPVYSHHCFLQTFHTGTVTAQFTHTTAFYKRFIQVLWLPSLLTPLLVTYVWYKYCDCPVNSVTPLPFTNVSYKYCDCPVYSHHCFYYYFY